MKLWLVLYAAGQVGGTWGPLPYDMNRCIEVREERRADLQKWIDTKTSDKGEAIPEKMLDNLKTWRFECERHNDRPGLGPS